MVDLLPRLFKNSLFYPSLFFLLAKEKQLQSFSHKDFFRENLSWEVSFNTYSKQYFKFFISQYDGKRHFDFYFIDKLQKADKKIFTLILDGEWWYLQETLISKTFHRYLAYTAPFFSFPNAYFYFLASRPQFDYDGKKKTFLGSLVLETDRYYYYQKPLSSVDKKKLYTKIENWQNYLEKSQEYQKKAFFANEKIREEIMKFLLKNESSVLKNNDLINHLSLFPDLSVSINNLKKFHKDIKIPEDFMGDSFSLSREGKMLFINAFHSNTLMPLISHQKKYLRLPIKGLSPIILDFVDDHLIVLKQILPSNTYHIVSLDTENNYKVESLVSYKEKNIRFISGKLSPNKENIVLLGVDIASKKGVLRVLSITNQEIILKKTGGMVGENISWFNDDIIFFSSLKKDDTPQLSSISLKTKKVEFYSHIDAEKFLITKDQVIWRSFLKKNWFRTPKDNLKKMILLKGFASYDDLSLSNRGDFLFHRVKNGKQSFTFFKNKEKLETFTFPFFVKSLFLRVN